MFDAEHVPDEGFLNPPDESFILFPRHGEIGYMIYVGFYCPDLKLMILTCSSCATRYLIDPVSVGTDGREVKCAKCGHRWREMPPQDSPLVLEEAIAENGGQGDANLSIEEMLAKNPKPGKSRKPPPRRKVNWIGWILFLVLVGAVVAGGFFLRNQIVDLWPPAVKLYNILKLDVEPTNKLGLVIDGVQSKTVVEDGVTTLTVSGKIVNITDMERPVPRINIQLVNKKGQHVYSWSRKVEAPKVMAWGEVAFSSSMKQPPKEAVSVQVNFVPIKKPENDENKAPAAHE